MTAAAIAERVAAGAGWLDANRPGWVERINLETLDLSSACRCVLGQEWGDYYDAPENVRDDASARGFTATNDLSEFPELTAAWRQLVIARRVLSA